MQFLAIFAFCTACVFVLIIVHEAGHYFAGLVGGIPGRDMRIRLLRFPQHVEICDSGEWVSPLSDRQRYIDLVWQHLTTTPRVYIYVCGGLLVETFFTVSVSVVLITLDRPKLALAIAGLSLMMILPWLIIDAISIARGKISGDLSGLWFLARLPTVVLLVVFLAARGAVIWYTIAEPSAAADGGGVTAFPGS